MKQPRRKPYSLMTPEERREYHRNWERTHRAAAPEFDVADVVAILRELAGVKKAV